MSICYKLVTTVSVILLITVHASSQAPELSSTLYSTISGAFVAFSNENITFTCIVRGSNAIEWSSVDYIGTGGRTLEFISTDTPGSQLNAGETLATLVRATQDVIIESRLNIRVQSTISVATIRCQDGGTGENTQITFRLAGNDTSVACDRQAACPDETVNCVCATGNSNALAWVIDRLEFTSNDPLQTRRSVNALGILTNRHSDNRIQVITSNLTLTASTDDTNLVIQCENVDGSTSNTFPINISQSCPDPSEQVTTSAGNEAASCTCVGPIITAVIFPIIIIIAAIVAMVAVLIIYKKKEFDLQEAYSKKQTDLITDYENKEKKLKKDYEDKESSLQQEYEEKKQECEEEYEKKQQKCEKKQEEYEKEQQECEKKQEEYKKKQQECERKQRDLQQEYDKKKRLLEQECDRIKSGLQQQQINLKAQENEMKKKVGSLKQQLEEIEMQQQVRLLEQELRDAKNTAQHKVNSSQHQLETALRGQQN